MSKLLTYVPSMGEAILRDSIQGVKLEFEPVDSFEVVFPSNSRDYVEVKHTESVKYRVVLRYNSTGVGEPAEGEETGEIVTEEVHAVLYEGIIELRNGRKTLDKSEPYLALDEKVRKKLDNRIRFYKNQLLIEEGIRNEIERRQRRNDIPGGITDPTVDLAPDISATELVINEEDAAKQQDRIDFITKKINGYQNTAAAVLSLKDMKERLGEDADHLLAPAIAAAKREVAQLND